MSRFSELEIAAGDVPEIPFAFKELSYLSEVPKSTPMGEF